ncbi:MAG: hypothetical protein JNJ88_19155 [Planctomycetes bacterium]|nr:hypothetical protein [Planctomycetota bacterium]
MVRSSVIVPLFVALLSVPSGPWAHGLDPAGRNGAERRVDAISKRSGGGWRIRWDGGRPAFASGGSWLLAPGGIGSESEALAIAASLLQEVPELCACGAALLDGPRIVGTGPLYVLEFGERWAGLEVVGARLQLQLHRSGRLVAWSDTTLAIPEGFPRRPSLTPAEAQEAAQQLAGGGQAEVRDFVVGAAIERGIAEPRLAYVTAVSGVAGGEREIWTIDACSGARLSAAPEDFHAADIRGTVTGTLNPALSGAAPPVPNIPISGVTVSVAGIGSAITDFDGNFIIPTAVQQPQFVKVTLDGPSFDIDSATGDFTASKQSTPSGTDQVVLLELNKIPQDLVTPQLNAAVLHRVADEYVRSRIGGFVGFPAQVVAVNLPIGCLASYNPSSKSLQFGGELSGCVNFAFSTILFHEFGHSVDDFYGGIQAPELSEALGDVLATYLTHQPVIGEGASGSPGGLRSVENAAQWPGASCGGDPYCLSQPFAGFAWEVRKRAVASLGDAAGVALAERLLLGTFPANNTAIPDALVQVFLLDDDDGILSNGTPHYALLSAAASAKGFAPPPIATVSVSHLPHPDTWNQTQPFTILANVGSLTGSAPTSVSLEWWADGIPFPALTAMLPDANGTYRAQIPALQAPIVVSYRFRIVDSLGLAWEIPPAGNAYSFAVGKKTIVLQSDFESGPAGWQHAALVGNDSWQLGTPLGGSQLDPTFAAEGAACFGNDLGAGASGDGLYDSGEVSYLESPPFSAGSSSNLRVRFRRWLTVEKGSKDQATLSVGGATLFMNPSANDILDTEWTYQDLALPSGLPPQARLRFTLAADGDGQLGGWNIDDVEVYRLEPIPQIAIHVGSATTAPPLNSVVTVDLTGTLGASWNLYASATYGAVSLPGFGVVEVGEPVAPVGGGQIPATGGSQFAFFVPFHPALIGLKTWWVAGAVTTGASLPQISNVLELTFQ